MLVEWQRQQQAEGRMKVMAVTPEKNGGYARRECVVKVVVTGHTRPRRQRHVVVDAKPTSARARRAVAATSPAVARVHAQNRPLEEQRRAEGSEKRTVNKRLAKKYVAASVSSLCYAQPKRR
jgi:hypothetical protein